MVGSCDETNQCVFQNICDGDDEDTQNLRPCQDTRDCTDSNICTVEICVDQFCRTSPNPDTSNSACCQVASDCPVRQCTIATCPSSTFTCAYRTNTTCEGDNFQPQSGYEADYAPPPPPSEEIPFSYISEVEYTAGDYIFAIIGIVILVCLISIFCVVLILVCIQSKRQQLE